jgi:putative DNA primase/helicase
LVTSSEPNEGFRFDEGLIKQLTGGDKVTARKLYGEEFEFNPEFKLWLATNHKPIIRGTDDGIWRRMIVIPFNVQIPEHKVDKDLKYKLQREASGILNWAVDGCLKWQREGLKTPESIQQSVEIYREEMDVIEAFVEDCLVKDKDKSLQASQVYRLYKQWATENTQYLMSSTKFGKEFSGKFKKRRLSQGQFYMGVGRKYDLQFLNQKY